MTRVLQPDAAGIADAAAILRAGGLAAFGTETVYGLGADATQPEAIARLYAAKGRPAHNPLISHFADADAAFAHVLADARARLLAAQFWPGPLTLVLPMGEAGAIVPAARAGLPSAAVRVPQGAALQSLLRAVGRPVAAPSANRSGHVSPTTAAHVLADLGGRIDAVLDTGPCAVGVESSVLDLTGDAAVLLRPGGIARETLSALIGPVRLAGKDAGITAPGMLASHYAPVLPLRLQAARPAADEALLAFGPAPPPAALMRNLSARGDLEEAAHNLFAALRALDQEARARGLRGIAVMPIPESGIGAALQDRLTRAAAPRG